VSARIERVRGSAIEPYLPDLAALRREVFREYPYLYQGSFAYERHYLQCYVRSARGVLVLARDGEQVVGASTALPLAEHGEGLAPLFAEAGLDPERVFYFGESVLRKSHRGQGIGHAFFDQREAAARELGFSLAAFCAVVRPAQHPARPADYVPHDAFWTKRGFRPRPELVAQFSWRDLGDADETPKPMLFWLKELAA
jgi:GNAT superfamily N-acetyltransferase